MMQADRDYGTRMMRTSPDELRRIELRCAELLRRLADKKTTDQAPIRSVNQDKPKLTLK